MRHICFLLLFFVEKLIKISRVCRVTRVGRVTPIRHFFRPNCKSGDFHFHFISLLVQQILKHRRVKHHGYEFLYTTNNIDKDHPLPDGIPPIYGCVIDDIMATGHVQCRPDQLTINQYQPGQGNTVNQNSVISYYNKVFIVLYKTKLFMKMSSRELLSHVEHTMENIRTQEHILPGKVFETITQHCLK